MQKQSTPMQTVEARCSILIMLPVAYNIVPCVIESNKMRLTIRRLKFPEFHGLLGGIRV
ncbi:hypothetical protein L873DRAFT_1800895 [Choiromyces venosus 120613-1]|uniref:Uncharacterized protein n=1 Tax=Choiromyces venosus 120613-1 TaxID=1336337 RepID=A0A3N4JY70_9PEZI|nr:hypothetical protein L873DRAFT_1800895 [Choiromyces venosus 120613-1]